MFTNSNLYEHNIQAVPGNSVVINAALVLTMIISSNIAIILYYHARILYVFELAFVQDFHFLLRFQTRGGMVTIL